ncbi:MAG: TraR/DksA C4-type zinc finger protein [Opitutales bacterium]|nr:TraR/DksA C4-type zinc finger protein [Opitutales bacterium]
MSAKKKSAAKKSAVKQSAAKPKTARKNVAQKKAEKKTASTSSSTTKAAKAAIDRVRAKKSQKDDGGTAGSNANRKSAPSAFTLDHVREILKKKQFQEKDTAKPNKPKAVKAEKPVKKTVADDIPVQKSKHAAASLNDILGLGSSQPASKQVPEKWQHYYDLLVELRKQVKDELNMHSSETLKRSQKEDAGDIVTSADAGTDNFDRDFALSLLSSEQEALNEIEAAIQRIYRGSYGVCEETGKPINAERLEAVPFTRFSLEGQRQHEMNARRRVQRTGAFLNEGSADAISFNDDDNDN